MAANDTFYVKARKCMRCGRLLTSEDAVERGYGCQCMLKARIEEEAKKPIDGQMTIFDILKEEYDDGSTEPDC